jgi:hypothetical protein
LFYGNTRPGNEKTINEQEIATGVLLKPAYFVVKIQQRDEFMSIYPELIQIGSKGGFVFLKRESSVNRYGQ